MPSPVGHALAATALGWAIARPERDLKPLIIQTATLVAIGTAPDLDILWGRHSLETHSVGAALIVASAAAYWRWPIGIQSRFRIFLAVVAIWWLHPVMDAFAPDGEVPYGNLMFWPFSAQFVIFPHPLFDPISRALNQWVNWRNNFIAAGHEILKLGPFVLFAWITRRRTT